MPDVHRALALHHREGADRPGGDSRVTEVREIVVAVHESGGMQSFGGLVMGAEEEKLQPVHHRSLTLLGPAPRVVRRPQLSGVSA